MKKSSVFILLLTFLLSIFLISFFGLQVRDEHMKRYFSKAEFINTEVMEFSGKQYKYLIHEFDPEHAPSVMYLEYVVEPADVTDSDGYEFIIVGGNGTFIDNEEEYPYAEINKDRVTFYHECDITVMLRTTDGSGLSDQVIIYCEKVDENAV